MHRFTVISASLALATAAAGQPLSITFRGVTNLTAATATDQNGTAFTIAGMSGLTRRSGDEYLAVMDNSNKLVRLSLTLNPNGSIASASVIGGISLAQIRDYEGIAYVPGTTGGPQGGTAFLCEEGTPAVHEFSLGDGAFIRTLAVPTIFTTRRANFGFESLTRRSLTGELWTANEEALAVDGGTSTPSLGTTVRLLRYTGEPLAPEIQFAYITEPLHGSVISSARSGLCDLVGLPSGRIIGLERSFAFNLGGLFQTRIYELDLSGAQSVGELGGLSNQAFVPVAKRLLYQDNLNNLEGLCLGPRLPGGASRYALLGVIDDGDPLSVNAVVSFELSGGVACIADFNADDIISVQDIFDFLAAYFASSPLADVNGAGGVTVQDIFDFLAAYFEACD